MLAATRLFSRSCNGVGCDIVRKQQFSTIIKNVSFDGDSHHAERIIDRINRLRRIRFLYRMKRENCFTIYFYVLICKTSTAINVNQRINAYNVLFVIDSETGTCHSFISGSFYTKNFLMMV